LGHGTADQIVRFEFGQKMKAYLTENGIQVSFHAYPGVGHTYGVNELKDISDFLQQHLPSH
jgi:predicted esterase